MIDLEKIPHIDEISHHGVFSGTHPKKTATFQERCRNRNKVMPSLEEAIRKTGLRDGMTISFHHHFRNGDHILNMVLDQLAAMGFRNLTLAASSLAAVHSPLIGHIRSGLITHIETSGLRGALAEEISRGLMDFPVVFRSHGGRAAAVSSGDLHIDVAFLGAPSCDPYGNANGYSRDGEDGIACGSLGYARTDAEYADQVVVITNHLVPYPNAPWAIPEHDVDYVVVTDDIGDPKGIMSGATRYTKDPKELLIAKTAANVIEAAGYLYDGFSMQMGSGGASLATARFLRQKMLDRHMRCRFALGGITGQIAAMYEEGLIDRILDVQSFDLDAAKSLKENHFHHQISATYYASHLAAADVILFRNQRLDRGKNGLQLLFGGKTGFIVWGVPLDQGQVQQASHANHEKLIQIAGENGDKFEPLQQGNLLIQGLQKHTFIESEPGELPVLGIEGVGISFGHSRSPLSSGS